ncbi:MAG: ATP-binding protein [Polyangiaceae bacterium]
MPEGSPAVLQFDQARAQLEAGAAAILASVAEPSRNAALPSVDLRRGKTRAEIVFKQLGAADFFPLVETVSPYFKDLRKLRSFYQTAYFEADLFHDYARRRAVEKKEDILPPITVEMKWDPRRGTGTIAFERDGFLAQDELNALLEIVKKLGIREAPASASPNPEQALSQLGAVVFHATPDFGEDRVAGYDGVKREVRETVVMPLLHPELFTAVTSLARTRPGSSVPRAVLFEGPPGTGKTTMARVMASASNLPLVYVPLESIMSKWVGDSEKRLDAIFDLAGTLGKSIVFLDEIDAFAGSRDKGDMPEYTRRILSVLLRQMQGLVDTSGVVLIGATNRKDDLDPALLSRFTRSIYFPLPDDAERTAIIGYYARHLADAERETLSALCHGRSGREIEDACGTAERMWATELVMRGEKTASPPAADRYAAAFRLKFAVR